MWITNLSALVIITIQISRYNAELEEGDPHVCEKTEVWVSS